MLINVVVVQSLSCIWLFVTPWTAACQASLSFSISRSLLKFMSTEWCHPTISSSVTPFSSCPQSFPASGSFLMSQLFALGGQRSFSFSISPSNEYSVLISFRIDWFELFAAQQTHKGLFQWVCSLNHVDRDWSFNFSISPSKEYSGLISFRIDWFDLLAVQGTLKSVLQPHY